MKAPGVNVKQSRRQLAHSPSSLLNIHNQSSKAVDEQNYDGSDDDQPQKPEIYGENQNHESQAGELIDQLPVIA